MAGRVLEPAAHSDNDFMTRVQLALDMPPRQLANALGVPLADVVDRQGPRAAMSSAVVDPFWTTLQEYVNSKLAGILALKEELDRKIRLDRYDHAEQTRRVRERP